MANNNLSFPSQYLKYLPTTKKKKQLLVYSDCVLSTTGFGILSRHILDALYKTGEYEIDQLAINYTSEFYDKEKIPYCIVPAKLDNPSDPYGKNMFIQALQKKQYDIVFVINDTFVVEELVPIIEKIKEARRQAGHKVFNLVYYYPVDCRLLHKFSSMVRTADKAVAYSNFAKQSAKDVGIYVNDVIYHGVNTEAFKPLPIEIKKQCRKQYLNADDDTFVVVNVNRNSVRKDISHTIYAFSEFRKLVPKSILYLHTKIQDTGTGIPLDLQPVLDECKLSTSKDVIFPQNYNVANGFPEQILNQFYNCGDCFLTTDLGEGFSLTQIEAMSAGVPVIAPDNTVRPEIIGKDRGYLYPCKERVYIDASGLRPRGRTEDILCTLKEAYYDWLDNNQKRKDIIKNARLFAEENSWKNIGKQWVKLFSELKEKPTGKEIVGISV